MKIALRDCIVSHYPVQRGEVLRLRGGTRVRVDGVAPWGTVFYTAVRPQHGQGVVGHGTQSAGYLSEGAQRLHYPLLHRVELRLRWACWRHWRDRRNPRRKPHVTIPSVEGSLRYPSEP
jgi:hypothetical protein